MTDFLNLSLLVHRRRRLALASGVIASALALALAAGRPDRSTATISGLFFVLLLVPALQSVAGAFLGWPTAVAVGLCLGAMIVWQVAVPPRPLVEQPVQWPAGFTAPDQQYKATLMPPARSRARRLLSDGGKATLGVCLAKGTGTDLAVLLEGRAPTVASPPTASYCWLEFGVPADLLPNPPAATEVTIRPAGSTLPPPEARTVVIGGYTRPRAQGGQSGGAQFFDGSHWRSTDLTPLADGPHLGRLFVELHILDRSGHIAEVWY